MSFKSPFKDVNKKKPRIQKTEKPSSSSYALRSLSPDVNSLNSSSTSSKTSNNKIKIDIAPNSPSSQKCPSCHNVEKIRNFNLSEAVKEFTEKLEDYKLLSKSLADITSCLDHAVDAIKHFILKFDTDTMNDYLTTSVKNIETIKGNLADLNNYITKLDSIEDKFANFEEMITKSTECNERVLRENCKLDEIESYIHNKLETIESITQVNIKEKDNLVLHKISNLEQLCNELKQKVDDCKHISYHRDTQLEELEELINSKLNSLGSPLSTDNVTVIHRISKVEEISNNLHRKIDSFINHHSPIAASISTPHVPRQIRNNAIAVTARNIPHQPTRSNITPTPEARITPRDCLILGDSNSKYINIDTNHIKTTRIPTYRISDINPEQCRGYSRIWIHVGINDLKTRNCRGPADVHMYHNLLLQKLHQIRLLCPNSKLIVSPILPTGVPALNERARLFTNLLYRGPQWFELLDFRVFCGNDDRLIQRYRCYGNPHDRIHLGRAGIELLKDTLVSRISKVDTRSYNTVLQTGHAQNHRT